MRETTIATIEKLADDHARAFAQAFIQVNDGSFERLSELEDVIGFLFDLLDSEQFLSVINTLHDALDCPSIEERGFFANEETLDFICFCQVKNGPGIIVEKSATDDSEKVCTVV